MSRKGNADCETANSNPYTYARMMAWWTNYRPTPDMTQIDMYRLFDSTFMHEVRIVARAR